MTFMSGLETIESIISTQRRTQTPIMLLGDSSLLISAGCWWGNIPTSLRMARNWISVIWRMTELSCSREGEKNNCIYAFYCHCWVFVWNVSDLAETWSQSLRARACSRYVCVGRGSASYCWWKHLISPVLVIGLLIYLFSQFCVQILKCQ